MAAVVNVKVAAIRPRYRDLRGWCQDPQNAYIGRKGVVSIDGVRYPLADSPFANPYEVGAAGDRETVIKKYEEYIRRRLREEEGLVDRLRGLHGKALGCWCAPEPCHGDVLVRLVAEWDKN